MNSFITFFKVLSGYFIPKYDIFLTNILILVGMTTNLIVYKDSLYVILIIDFYMNHSFDLLYYVELMYLKDLYRKFFT